MTEPTFLTTAQVVEIHDGLIELHGGSFGLRDAGALESAVATPMATFGGEYLHPSIPAMAAAYLFHIAQNPRLPGRQQAMRRQGFDRLSAGQRLGTHMQR